MTFILKNVMLVSRSTVDLRSCNLSGLLAGKLFCYRKDKNVNSSPTGFPTLNFLKKPCLTQYPVHGEVNPQGVMELVEKLDKSLFLHRNNTIVLMRP